MDFYLTAPDGGRIHLPLNPERVTAQTESKMQTFEVIGLGDINLPRGITPARISWEGVFPGAARRDAPFVKAWQDPKALAGQISAWRRNNSKVRLLITETPLNLSCFIAAFEHTWSGGHSDCYYRLDLTEARDIVVLAEGEQRDRGQIAGQGQGAARPAPPPARTYTVRPGDTLWAIAKRTLGNGGRWREIYTANVAVIGKDPGALRPGQVLRIAGLVVDL